MYPQLRWLVISGSSIATVAGIALSAVAQSTPPPGVTLPPTTPDTVEQTIPNPSQSSPFPEQSSPLPEPSLETPTTPEQPESTSSSSEPFLVNQVEVLGNTVLRQEIAQLTKQYENREVTFEELFGTTLQNYSTLC